MRALRFETCNGGMRARLMRAVESNPQLRTLFAIVLSFSKKKPCKGILAGLFYYFMALNLLLSQRRHRNRYCVNTSSYADTTFTSIRWRCTRSARALTFSRPEHIPEHT